MVKETKPTKNIGKRMKPALTREGKENQMIALAMDIAEQQLRDGTASSQVITHFLKMGSEREKLERLRLEEEVKLQRAKTESIESQKEIKELYSEALAAMRRYSGHGDDNHDD